MAASILWKVLHYPKETLGLQRTVQSFHPLPSYCSVSAEKKRLKKNVLILCILEISINKITSQQTGSLLLGIWGCLAIKHPNQRRREQFWNSPCPLPHSPMSLSANCRAPLFLSFQLLRPHLFNGRNIRKQPPKKHHHPLYKQTSKEQGANLAGRRTSLKGTKKPASFLLNKHGGDQKNLEFIDGSAFRHHRQPSSKKLHKEVPSSSSRSHLLSTRSSSSAASLS